MLLLIIPIVLSLIIAGYAWQHRQIAGMYTLFALEIAICWWSATYALALAEMDILLKLVLVQGAFFSHCFCPSLVVLSHRKSGRISTAV